MSAKASPPARKAAAPTTSAVRQLEAAATAGRIAAATAPPSGSPAWRMPMASPSRSPRNQAETELLPPGCVVL